MADADPHAKAQDDAKVPPRRLRGFEPASGLLKDRIRLAGESRGFAVTRLLTHWPEIVGQELAQATRPVKISYAQQNFGACLTLLVRSSDAPVVQMQLQSICERVNGCYGYAAISRIRLTQSASAWLMDNQVPPADNVPAPELVEKAKETAQGVQDGALKAALELLARNILIKQNKMKG